MSKAEIVASREKQFKADVWTAPAFARAVAACGSKESAKQFMASVLDLYHEGGDYLQECDSQAILSECLKAAQLNLPLVKSLGYAYVVPFNNKYNKKVPTFIIGWKGLVQLAQNTGKYRYINADAVYEGEEVSFNRLTGGIQITGEKKEPNAPAIGYFAYIQLLNGFEKTVYMTKAEVLAYAKKYSKSFDKGPWQTEFDAMARKTVLRKVLKYGPASTQMIEAEQEEVRAAEVYAQAEVTENANTGETVSLPEDAAANDQPSEAPAEEPQADPGF